MPPPSQCGEAVHCIPISGPLGAPTDPPGPLLPVPAIVMARTPLTTARQRPGIHQTVIAPLKMLLATRKVGKKKKKAMIKKDPPPPRHTHTHTQAVLFPTTISMLSPQVFSSGEHHSIIYTVSKWQSVPFTF